MTIFDALRVRLPREIRNAGIDSVQTSHKLANAKLATDVEMVA
jgi:hypothetical protein